MLCVEVTVNGTRRCLAAVDDLTTFDARIVHDRDLDGAGTARLDLSGTSRDESTRFEWPQADGTVSVGDVVTIRVTEATAADLPTASPNDPGATVRAIYRQMIELAAERSRLRLDEYPTPDTPTLKSLLFWIALMVIGVVIWILSSR